MDITYHYPPELMSLLIDAIPRLCRSKKDTLLFFRGAGISTSLTNDLAVRIKTDSDSISKYEIARTILQRLNEDGETTLRERREVLKRVVEFENFSSCWPNDQLVAKGLVAEIRQVVNVKDSFTRMKIEREQEKEKRRAEQQAKLQKIQQRRKEMADIRKELFALFSPDQVPQKRGKALESILNRLFKVGDILIREAFTLVGTEGEGIVEQIDGVIEIDGTIYIVEMKWLKGPVDVGDVARHQVRIFGRSGARGIFISASGYTEPAITNCREFLHHGTLVLCGLQEIVMLLDRQEELKPFLKEKINAAIVAKNPLYKPLG